MAGFHWRSLERRNVDSYPRTNQFDPPLRITYVRTLLGELSNSCFCEDKWLAIINTLNSFLRSYERLRSTPYHQQFVLDIRSVPCSPSYSNGRIASARLETRTRSPVTQLVVPKTIINERERERESKNRNPRSLFSPQQLRRLMTINQADEIDGRQPVPSKTQ